MRNNVVSVVMWNDEIGRIYWDSRKGVAIFNYNPRFASKNKDIFPIVAPIESAYGKGFPISGTKGNIYHGLPPFIADSLPDRWGNQVFEQWAAQNHIPKNSLSPVDKLSFIGKRGMGALEFRPATSGLEKMQSIELDSLYKLAKEIFESRENAVILPEVSLDMQSLYEVGTSAGGQHPKAIIAINRETGEIRSGQIQLPPEYDYYILKFAESDQFPFTNMEMAYYEMAKDAGINMMDSRLIEVEDKWHFLTMRYDRLNGEKVHIQTLAAINPEATSYDDMFETCRILDIPATEQAELYRRMVFNILAGNVDDHVKNFSFMMCRDGSWHITPAYDLIFSTNLDGSAYENAHSLAILGKTIDISIEDLIYFARMNDIKGPDRIIDKVATIVSHFRDYALSANVDNYWIDRIEEYLHNLIPEQYRQNMTGFRPTVVESYISEDGFHISDVSIQETYQHDFWIMAKINDKPLRYVVGRKNGLAQKIIKDGRNKMPIEAKKDLVNKFLIPLAKR